LRESASGPGAQRHKAAPDRRFYFLATSASTFVLLVIVAIAAFLAWQAVPSLRIEGWRFFSQKLWLPDQPKPAFGIEALAFGTALSSAIALVVGAPVAIGTALFLTEIAPPWMGRLGGYLVDMLAAVPSVVYGLWGIFVLVPKVIPLERFMSRWIGFIPIFKDRTGTYGHSIFAAGLILAIMILPIVAAIARELFRQVPVSQREAAMALGSTRWEIIRLAVLPFSRSGLIGASMLGLGRALGETIAVALVLYTTYTIDPHIFDPGGNTIAANIATQFGEALRTGRSALIASGLVLFGMSLFVNLLARGVIYRSLRSLEARP
jgi:phosphate transport system permease protein